MNAATITGVRNIAVPVTDQDRALEFYVGKLGFQVVRDAPLQQLGGRWIELAPPGSTTTIALIPAREGASAGIDTGIRLSSPDVPGAHADLAARGVDVEELLSWPGIPPMFVFRDQDGNRFVVVE
jgi:catechol 2,3-dioxygenase-like lactoylglutathione lyase family enzyme